MCVEIVMCALSELCLNIVLRAALGARAALTAQCTVVMSGVGGHVQHPRSQLSLAFLSPGIDDETQRVFS